MRWYGCLNLITTLWFIWFLNLVYSTQMFTSLGNKLYISYKEGGQYSELIINKASMVDVLSGDSHLQTATAHSKGHWIHINEAWEGFLRRGFKRGVFIFVNGNLDTDLLPPSIPDVLCESGEPWVGVDDWIIRKQRIWEGVLDIFTEVTILKGKKKKRWNTSYKRRRERENIGNI